MTVKKFYTLNFAQISRSRDSETKNRSLNDFMNNQLVAHYEVPEWSLM